MTTKEIIAEYLNCKSRVIASAEELKFLEKAPEFVKVTRYGEEISRGYLKKEDIHIKALDKRRDLEILIAIDQGFIAKVDSVLKYLEQRLGTREYEIFDLRYLKERTLEYIAIKYGYTSPSTIHRRLKKQEKIFEKMLNV